MIAHLQGSNQTVVRDVTDIDHPSTIATIDGANGWADDGWASPSFVSAAIVSYTGKQRDLIRTAISGAPSYKVQFGCGIDYLVAYRWSTDGQSLTYVVETQDAQIPNGFEWHLVAGGTDRVIGNAPTWCHCGNGSEDFSFDVGFSPDDQVVSLVDYLGMGTDLQVRRFNGSLIGSEIRGDRTYPDPVTLGVWSGSSLFFRDSHGVERWHDGAIAPFLPGVAWLHPRASPAGGEIVYAARGSDGQAHVYVVNTYTMQTRQLSARASNWPMFLSPRYVWYRGERPCTPSDGICLKAALTGKTYIYDLQTGTEWESIITDIADVWPHGS